MSESLSQTKWWKVECMKLDCNDYLSGDMNKEDFIKYMKYDLEELNKLIKELESKDEK